VKGKRCVIGLGDCRADDKRRLIEGHCAADANHDGAIVEVEQNRCQATCGNSCQKRSCVNCRVADPDSVGLVIVTEIANIDIVTARRNRTAGGAADGNIVVPGGTIKQGAVTKRCVAVPGSIANEGIGAKPGVAVSRSVVIQRKISDSRVVVAVIIKHHCGRSIGGVSCASGIQDE
jgi:hypothetical protein